MILGDAQMDKRLYMQYQEDWNRYYQKIKKFIAYNLSQYPAYIEDCCEEVFEIYLNALLDGKKIENTSAWLYKVARIVTIKSQKKLIKATNLSVSLDDDAVHELTPVVEYDFTEEIIKSKFSEDELIQLVSKTLSDVEKMWFRECFLEPKDITTLAKEQNISIGAVYKRKRVLRAKLKSSIKKVVVDIENEIYRSHRK